MRNAISTRSLQAVELAAERVAVAAEELPDRFLVGQDRP